MRILIFGATGKTGRIIASRALEKGHFVTAFARAPSSIYLEHPKFNIARGDILDYEAVDGAIVGQDVIVSALGPKSIKKDTSLSEGVKNIIGGMKNHNVTRIIFMSSLFVRDSRQQLTFFYRLCIPFIIRNVLEDKERQEKYLLESDLDWTIVRPGVLTNGKRTGSYKVIEPGSRSKIARARISRADVADFILEQLEYNTYIRIAVGLSY